MAAPIPPAKLAASILKQIDTVIKERGHGEVVVSIRDGKVQFITIRRNYLPENLPE